MEMKFASISKIIEDLGVTCPCTIDYEDIKDMHIDLVEKGIALEDGMPELIMKCYVIDIAVSKYIYEVYENDFMFATSKEAE